MHIKNIKGKRAILLPETLKIIVAVLCILLLAYLIILLYGIFTKRTEMEQAKAALEQVVTKINTLKDNDAASASIGTRGSPSWFLVSLADEKDICICFGTDQPDDCKQKGKSVCKNTGYDVKMQEQGISVDYFLTLEQPITKFYITRNSNEITIQKYSQVQEQEALTGIIDEFLGSEISALYPEFKGDWMLKENIVTIEDLIKSIPTETNKDIKTEKIWVISKLIQNYNEVQQANYKMKEYADFLITYETKEGVKLGDIHETSLVTVITNEKEIILGDIKIIIKAGRGLTGA